MCFRSTFRVKRSVFRVPCSTFRVPCCMFRVFWFILEEMIFNFLVLMNRVV